MSVLMVLLQPFPPDIRVEKEAQALISAGYDVCLIATGNTQEIEEIVVDGVRVFRLPRLSGWRERNREICDNLFHQHSFWTNHIIRIGRLVGAEVIHGHDLWVLGNCVAASKVLKIPVVADLHENWPAAMSLFHPRDTWLDHLTHPVLFGYKQWARFEGHILHKVDCILTVVPEAADRLVKMHGLPRHKIAVVSNTENVELADATPVDHAVVEQYAGQFILTYVGGFNHHRGLDMVIRAMPRVAARVPHVKLLLVGRGNEAHLQEIIWTSAAAPFVEMLGWQPFEKVYTYLTASDVCLVPHVRHEHTDNTVPHKLFQYMYMRKPVLVSDCPPLKRIVEETHAGLVFRADDQDNFVDAVCRLASDPQLCRDLGENGHAAVTHKYHWREDAKVLLRCYAALGKGPTRESASTIRQAAFSSRHAHFGG